METLKNIDKLLDDIDDYYHENGDFNLHYIEKIFIENVLEMYNGNRTKSAKMLNISIRTIRNKIREYESEKSI